MEEIHNLFKEVGKRYNNNLPHFDACIALVKSAHNKLNTLSTYNYYGPFYGSPNVLYNVFKNKNSLSRPVRQDLYIDDFNKFLNCLNFSMDSLYKGGLYLKKEESCAINALVYTSIMSVACCYDLWKPGSRKTPGTFFEFFMAALLQRMLPNAAFSKHIPLTALLNDAETAEGVPEDLDASNKDEEGAASVSTDLVIGSHGKNGGFVIPLKITTRERIVQPFAHQRILDSAFGINIFKSLLVCISETQLDKNNNSIKQICVPGTIKLFQKYLSSLSGIYYCDIPQRYSYIDIQRMIPVKSVGEFFKDIATYLILHKNS